RPIGCIPTTVDGKVGEYIPNVSTTYEMDGSSYTVRYEPPVKGKNGRPSSLIIHTPVETKGEFQIVVETWFDKLCKRFGLAREIETGDDSFDEQCYIRTDMEEFTKAYLSDPVKRVAIVDLRRFGFNSVSVDDGDVSVIWSGFDPLKHDQPNLVEDVAARLILLARNLPAHQPEFEHRTGQHRKMWQAVCWLGLVAYALTIFSLIAFTPVVTFDLLLRAAPVLLLGFPLFAFVSALLLSGTSTSHYKWGGLMLGSLILLPLGSAGSVALLNGLLDSSQPVTHTAVITEKYTSRSKNKTRYHVRCESWRKPGETLSYQISSAEYGAVVPRLSRMMVTTHAGGLGIEWQKSRQVVLNPPKP
ncbi:MAG: hypothetical protein L0241_15440, partial [Planctomycetia bacterium]|nr:hypothetical protein [Planctomycetia bacterium]